MRRFQLSCFVLLTCGLMTGCSVDRTWFQMSSNSRMPFFGFDLRMPRKKTSQVEPLSHEEQLAQNWDNQRVIQPVSHKKRESQTTVLNLPRISDLKRKHLEEDVSFNGPKSPFAP